MINELCEQIWCHPKFNRDLMWASDYGAKVYFNDVSTTGECVDESFQRIIRLIQSALIFSLSDDTKYREIAYETAILTRNSMPKLCREDYKDYDGLKAAISLILSRLGNFPAEQKYLQETSLPLDTLIPSPLWFERETHLDDNTVAVEGIKKITLTDFQLELWDAITDYPVVIVNAPTSAGKTFILQNHVIDSISKNNISNALYIVPTRALIEQVVKDFKALLKLSENSKTIIVTEVPNLDVISTKNIFVLTQERAQILLEQDLSIDLAIIDEAQNVSDSARGIILQSVIEAVKERNSHAKFIFATPFARNPEVFLSIFGFKPTDCKIIPVAESPVTQNLYNLTVVKNDLLHIYVSKLQKDGNARPICNILSKYELADERKYLAIISLSIGKDQNNIIFGSDPSICEGIAQQIAQAISVDEERCDADLLEFSDFIKEHIHNDYLLAETVKHGVVYHYGNLPSFIRKGIERLCVAGKIKYIVCTSTLLQGVNLPAQNIFIMNPSKGYDKDKTPIPLTAPEFWNLAGRAGRLTKDFEGNIFLVNLLEWNTNPILDTERRQFITSSFKKYVCAPSEGLNSFIHDREHRSGDSATQALENTFMKLFVLQAQGRLNEALEQLGNDLAPQQKALIIESMKTAATDITLPYEIYSRNPNVSVFRQQELYNYLLKRVGEKGPLYLIPPHPMHKFNDIKADYIRLFIKYSKYLSKDTSRQYAYISNLALLWMRGATYSELIQARIDYKNKKRKRGKANVNTVARELFDDIEFSLRFKYVKFSKCYNDLLSYVLRQLHEEKYESSIPPLHLFLELGGSSGTMISLMGMGLSRTAAAQIVPSMISTSMNREEIESWLKHTNIYALGLPQSVLAEIEQVLI